MKKLNGYRPTHKNKWLFTEYCILTFQELALLEFYADIVDFDKNHDGFGTFITDFIEMERIFRMSDSSLRNWHNELLRLGFIKATGKQSRYRLACFKRFIEPSWGGEPDKFAKSEVNQPIGFLLQQFGIDPQTIGQKVQQVGNKKRSLASNRKARYLGSSKDNSTGSSVAVNGKGFKSLVEERNKETNIDFFGRLPKSEDMGW